MVITAMSVLEDILVLFRIAENVESVSIIGIVS